jgi:hypothetical protein
VLLDDDLVLRLLALFPDDGGALARLVFAPDDGGAVALVRFADRHARAHRTHADADVGFVGLSGRYRQRDALSQVAIRVKLADGESIGFAARFDSRLSISVPTGRFLT